MATVMTNDQNYQNIAEAIRQCEDFPPMTPAQMPDYILNAFSIKHQDGVQLGYAHGYQEGET